MKIGRSERGRVMSPIYILFLAGFLFLVYAVFLYSNHENNDYTKLLDKISEEKAYSRSVFDTFVKEINDLRLKLSDQDALQTMSTSDIKKLKTEVEELKMRLDKKKVSELKLKFDSPVQFEVVRKPVVMPSPAVTARTIGNGKASLLDRAGVIRAKR